jgi:ApaG protein
MVSEITDGVKVSVFTEFHQEYSSPMQGHFVFAYRIKIENNSIHTVQLMRRKWTIYDSIGMVKIVEGDGVIGQQPVLEPGERHEYVSGCNLKSTIGKMVGEYQMHRVFDDKVLTVKIPEFNLIVPYILN